MAFVNFVVIKKIQDKYYDFFFHTIVGLFCVIKVEINVFNCLVCIVESINAVTLMFTLLCMNFYINCKQFALANNMLVQLNRRLSQYQQLLTLRDKNNFYTTEILVLKIFYRFHTKCLLTVMDMNKVFGMILFVSLLVHTPTNASTLISLIHHKVPQTQFPLAVIIVLVQLIIIFNIHYIAVMYSNILHNPAKKLVNCSVNLCLTVWKIKLVVRDRLKLLFYIEKFLIKSQKQKYGISYGPLVQLATFTSFAKVSVYLYIKNFKY